MPFWNRFHESSEISDQKTEDPGISERNEPDEYEKIFGEDDTEKLSYDRQEGLEADGFSRDALDKYEQVWGTDSRDVTDVSDQKQDEIDGYEQSALDKYEEIMGEGLNTDIEDDTYEYVEIKDGLTDSEKEDLRKATDWSDEILENIGSAEEADIYLNADLKAAEINGKECLIKDDIDLDQRDADGISNRDRMQRGRPPVNEAGEEIELHHIGQHQDSPLAELTMPEHRGTGNDAILHDKTKETEIDRNEFGKERRDHWKDRLDATEDI